MSVAPQVEPIHDKPHGPPGGWARALLGRFHVTGVFWYKIHYFVTGRPEWLLRASIWSFSTFFWLVLWRIRRAVASNLEAVLGPCGFLERQRRIWRTFWNFAWCASERYEQFRPERPLRFSYEGHDVWERIQASGRGCVFFTAHFGNWEVGPMADAAPPGTKIHLVREPEMNAPAQAFMEQLLRQRPRDNLVVHYAGSDLVLGAQLLLALRKGDIVALPGDRPRAGLGSLRTQLFGRPMDLPPGPAALARAADAWMVPLFVIREGRRHYRVVMREPFLVGRSDDKDQDIRAAVDRMGREVEWAIRERPHQWFCWARLW